LLQNLILYMYFLFSLQHSCIPKFSTF
jgi:hypothetical protein